MLRYTASKADDVTRADQTIATVVQAEQIEDAGWLAEAGTGVNTIHCIGADTLQEIRVGIQHNPFSIAVLKWFSYPFRESRRIIKYFIVFLYSIMHSLLRF